MIFPVMKNARLSLVTALLTLCGAGTPFMAGAQPAALEEVIVTATRRDESLQDVPIMVNAFSAEVIQEAGIQNADDLAILTPSLSISTNITPFTAAFRIRGIGTSQSDIALEPSVGLFIDDVYLSRSGLGMSDLNDIERIEVLHGPQGTLYGKNTNAGAISIFTKQPNPDVFEGYVESTVGDYDLGRLTAAASGPLSDTVAYRLTGNVHQQDGYFDNSGGEDLNGADDWYVLGKLLYQPSDTLAFLLSGSRVDRDTHCCGADAVQSEELNAELAARGLPIDKNDPYDYEIATDIDGEFKVRTDSLSLIADQELAAGALKSITAWGESNGTATRDVDLSQLDVIYQYNGVSSGDYFSQELRYASDVGGPLNYQLGLFYYQSTTNGGDNQPWTFLGEDIITVGSQTPELSRVLPPGIPLAFVAQPGDYIRAKVKLDTENVAVFGQTTYDLTNQWRVTGGLRWTYEQKDADLLVAIDSTAPSAALIGQSLLTFVTTPIDDDLTRDTDDINWMLNTSYDVFAETMVFASVATGSKSGGFNTVNGTANERAFDDESTISYETGIKSTLLDARLRTNASLFYTEISDYQAQQQLETGIGTRVSNQGDVETAGLDLNIEGLPLPNLTLTAGLLYLDKREITSGPDKGLELPFTAKYSGTLSATLVFPWAEGYLYTRADYSYMDDHLTNGSAVTEEKDIQERTTVNLKAGWRNDHWNVSIWAKNLTDDAYASLTAETLPLSGVDAYFLAPPRTYGATLRYDF
jgi:iron complex outermembrane receptor protein